jgi:hypothetical protein
LNTQKYISLLANPTVLQTEELSQLVSVIDAYPFFQSARALWLKGLKNENSFRYNDALKLTAAHTTNRDVLFEYITSDKFSQDEIARQILQHDSAINELQVVITEDISQTITAALDTQMKAELKKAEAILDVHLFEKKAQEVTQILTISDFVENNEEEATQEVILEVNAPLDFKKEDTHSFSEWLKLTTIEPISREAEPINNEEKEIKEREHKFDLIEKFITERPKLTPKTQKNPQKNLAKPFTKSSDSLMTETLAKVYVHQKNYKKAITAYKILILKYPEKSGFFADQIRAIEKLIEK